MDGFCPMTNRRAADLLPDGAAETLADWLQQRPGIWIAACDRSTEYARGIALGAPRAVPSCALRVLPPGDRFATAEGQVNRLKLLKRQSYDRSSLDLLRRRVLLAA